MSLAIARSLGLGTVAEGVESEPQVAALRALGGRVMQGYLFSRPVPVAEFERLLRAGPTGADRRPPEPREQAAVC